MCNMPTIAFHSMYLLNPALYQISSILVILSPIVLIANSYTHCNDRHKCMNWLLIFAVVRQKIVWNWVILWPFHDNFGTTYEPFGCCLVTTWWVGDYLVTTFGSFVGCLVTTLRLQDDLPQSTTIKIHIFKKILPQNLKRIISSLLYVFTFTISKD